MVFTIEPHISVSCATAANAFALEVRLTVAPLTASTLLAATVHVGNTAFAGMGVNVNDVGLEPTFSVVALSPTSVNAAVVAGTMFRVLITPPQLTSAMAVVVRVVFALICT